MFKEKTKEQNLKTSDNGIHYLYNRYPYLSETEGRNSTSLEFQTNIRNSSVKETNQQNYSNICEKLECIERATEVIEVPAGIYGIFKLYLCRNCVEKFRKRDEKSK